MDMIERYIEAVVRYLPSRQRSDITQELRGLIEDMLQQREGSSREATGADIEAVLLELGDPRKLADNYRGTSRYLIGPAFFDLYWLVLRIVLAAAGGGVLIATIIEMAAHPPADGWQALSSILGGLYSALIGAFGFVTLIFALNEHFNDKARDEMNRLKIEWHPSQLPPRPTASLMIKRADPIVAIIFLIIALIIVNVSINAIGFYFVSDGQYSIFPLFSDTFQVFVPWLNVSIGLAILIESFKLITGRWTLALVLGTLVQKTLGLIIALQMFADAKIFNPEFFSEIQRVFETSASMPADLPSQICRVIIIVAAVGYALELLTTGWKGVRIIFGLGSAPATKKQQ